MSQVTGDAWLVSLVCGIFTVSLCYSKFVQWRNICFNIFIAEHEDERQSCPRAHVGGKPGWKIISVFFSFSSVFHGGRKFLTAHFSGLCVFIISFSFAKWQDGGNLGFHAMYVLASYSKLQQAPVRPNLCWHPGNRQTTVCWKMFTG